MNITKSTLGALAFNGRETTYFDDTLKGFGVRVGKTSASYIVMYRNAYGKQKKLTIAKTTQITPAQAREEAKRILALVVQGKDPASDKIEKRKEITVSDLARMFLAAMVLKRFRFLPESFNRLNLKRILAFFILRFFQVLFSKVTAR